MREMARRLLDLLYPPRCAGCGVRGAVLCAPCLATLEPPDPPLCARCGIPLPAHGSQLVDRCAECRATSTTSILSKVRVATAYEGAARSVIHALKFQGERRLAEPLGKLLAVTYTREELRADVVVPVPLHPARQRDRGFNQAELLARGCARHLGLPLVMDALVRVRHTPMQSHLPRDQRRQNVAGAFALAATADTSRLTGQRILLIDDVTTTLSTLDAAATALRDAHPSEVSGLAVARPWLRPGPPERA